MHISKKIEVLRARRDELEERLNAIAIVERLLLDERINRASVLELDERVTKEWAETCAELDKLEADWLNRTMAKVFSEKVL